MPVTISDELRSKFQELITLILGSESMNDEERQYWINILPVMTPEQIANLRQILQNEKEQLAAIDAKYAKDAAKQSGRSVEEIGKIRKEKLKGQKASEHAVEEEERRREQEILKEISGEGG